MGPAHQGSKHTQFPLSEQEVDLQPPRVQIQNEFLQRQFPVQHTHQAGVGMQKIEKGEARQWLSDKFTVEHSNISGLFQRF